MTLLFSFTEDLEGEEIEGTLEEISRGGTKARGKIGSLLIADKLTVPENRQFFHRDRLERMLDKLLDQFGAALLLGRAGTGKTALAADYSRKFGAVSWLSIDSSDIEWEVFARYFTFAIARQEGVGHLRSFVPSVIGFDPDLVCEYVEAVFEARQPLPSGGKRLIVLDNTHNVFDAPWFEDFLLSLIFNLDPDSRLLVISRTQPPLPVWRLRSKQALGFASEQLLEFNAEETRKLFELNGLNADAARRARRSSYGRISRLMEMIANLRAKETGADT